jgi:Sugar (and other) transporter
MEYVGPEKRTLVGNVPLAFCLTLGFVTLPWIAYGLADWRLFSIVTSAPLAVTLIALWIVPESARWMVLRGKIDQTVKTLKQCAAVNGQSVPQDIYDEFQVSLKFLKNFHS